MRKKFFKTSFLAITLMIWFSFSGSAWGVEHSGWARRFAIRADHIFSRGRANEKEKWWFDLEEVNGLLRVPEQF